MLNRVPQGKPVALLATIGILALAGCGPGQILGPTMTIGEQARALAEAGVVHNADWTPYTQQINGVLMALVPAGCFQMGSTDEQLDYIMSQYGPGADRSLFDDEQPVHEVCFETPFWFDVSPVTNGQFAKLGGEAGEGNSFTEDNEPRNRSTWTGADTYCQKRGARLPTEAEWEFAMRGPDALIFPWGNIRIVEHIENETSTPGNRSWIGTHELLALGFLNVWEWVSDRYGTYPSERQVNPQGPEDGEEHVLRGGSVSFNRSNIMYAADRWHSLDFYASFSFRCALSYQP